MNSRRPSLYGRPMPKQPMKPRFIRMSDPLWEKAQQRASARGLHTSEYVRALIEEDLKKPMETP
jgi:hypothetical protein